METNKKQSPQYMKIYNDIHRKIDSGELFPGMQLDPEQELAKKYEVSRPTVRQAFLELEREGLLERVRGRGTFVSNPTKHNTSTHEVVGLVVPRLADAFIGRILTGVQEVFENKYTLSVHITNDSINKEQKIIEKLIDQQVAGLIIHPTSAQTYNPAIYKLNDKKIPFVMTGRHYKYILSNYVEMDNFKGAYNVVQFLYDKGHRNIGLVSKPSLTKSSIENRILGFFEAHKDLSLPISLENIFLNLNDNRTLYWNEQTSREKEFIDDQLRDYLKKADHITAVIALNDLIAADLMHLLEDLGRKPGKDISVVGFDNVNFCSQLKPPLTSVDTPTLELGRVAAGVLDRSISDPHHAVEQITIQSKLVIRGSISQC